MSAEWAARWPIHRAACNVDATPLQVLLGRHPGPGGPEASAVGPTTEGDASLGMVLPGLDELDEEGRWDGPPSPPVPTTLFTTLLFVAVEFTH